MDELPAERRAVLADIEKDEALKVIEMSTVTDAGVMDVKTEACERLLCYRVDQKMRTKKVSHLTYIYLHTYINYSKESKRLNIYIHIYILKLFLYYY